MLFSLSEQSHREWNLSVREKNTFLEVKCIEDELIDARRGRFRRHSAPVISFRPDDLVAAPRSPCKVVDGDSQYVSEASTISVRESCDASSSEASTCAEQKIKISRRIRPCKGARARHARFLARLMFQIESDPCNFNVARISWPPSLLEDDMAKQKVIQKLEAHRESVQDNMLPVAENGLSPQGTVVLSLAHLCHF